MKKSQIKVGGHYLARVSRNLVTVRVDAIRERSGGGTYPGSISGGTSYDVTNLKTGRKTTFRSAQKFRGAVMTKEPAVATKRQVEKLIGRSIAAPGPVIELTCLHGLPSQEPGVCNHGNGQRPCSEPRCVPDPTLALPPPSDAGQPPSSPLASVLRQSINHEQPGKADAPHLEVQALAGTGKTTTMIEGVKECKGLKSGLTPSPEQEAIWEALKAGRSAQVRISSFSTKITDELKARVTACGLDRMGVEARGIHSLGLQAITKRFGRVSAEKAKWIVVDLCCDLLGKDMRALKGTKDMDVVWAVDQLVSLCKQTVTNPTPAKLDQLTSHYDVELNGQRERVYDLVPQILERCREPKDSRWITFDDMIWLPLVHDLPIQKVDLQIVDECVPGWTPVMLADGSSKTIKEIVDSEEEFSVRSYSTKQGAPVNCRVIGKQKILNQKPLVKIRAKHLHKTGTNRKCNFVICTVDHKVWTINRGWVPAGNVVVGDSVIIETEAKTTQKGKVTKVGREKLANLQAGNQRGLGNAGASPELFNSIKGGNGRGPTLAEQTVLDALGGGWVWNHPVPTGLRRTGNYPTCYKIDVANPSLKIAIEIDGHSHRQSKEIDDKKDDLLRDFGWKIVRVSNRDAIQKTSSLLAQVAFLSEGPCISNNCPRPAEVVAVESVTIPDNYVYDITVESSHNFYANGILVHNCQDLNRMQQELMLRAGHRIAFVGDKRQAIFGFAGADAESMDRMRRTLGGDDGADDSPLALRGCITLPLTVTRRCGKAIVKEAQRWVPEYRAHESNPDGAITDARLDEGSRNYRERVQSGDFVLCRVNAPLVSQCFRFIKQGRKANILGRKVGEGLAQLVDKSKKNTVPDLIAWLDDWLSAEQANENAKKLPSEARLENLRDKHDCILAFTEGLSRVEEVKAKIASVFTEDKNNHGVSLSSIHKSKGLEARRVFFLHPPNAGLRRDKMQAWELEQEDNLCYVATTRAIEELCHVS